MDGEKGAADAGAINTPLCPAGHLPRKGGDWLGAPTSQRSQKLVSEHQVVDSENAASSLQLGQPGTRESISLLAGEMAGRPEGGAPQEKHRPKANRRLFRTPSHLLHALTHALEAEDLANRNGLLQSLDPRAKVAGALLMIIAATLLHSLIGLALLFVFAIVLALASRIPLMRLMKQVWLGVLAFTGAIALPSPFLVPGDVLATLPVLHWTITEQGLRSAAFLVGRAETAATFAALLVLTTRWPHVMKAMRSLGVPIAVVAVLGMTHRYIFVLMTTAAQMMEARRARQLGPLKPADQRRLIAGSAGVLLGRTLTMAGDVHMAMIARGYRGEVRLIDDFRFRARDGVALVLAALLPAAIVWMQR